MEGDVSHERTSRVVDQQISHLRYGKPRRSRRRGCQAISDVDEPLLAPLPDIDEQQSSFD